jgi:hypothetical protein
VVARTILPCRDPRPVVGDLHLEAHDLLRLAEPAAGERDADRRDVERVPRHAPAVARQDGDLDRDPQARRRALLRHLDAVAHAEAQVVGLLAPGGPALEGDGHAAVAEHQAGGALDLLARHAGGDDGPQGRLVAVDRDHAAPKLGRADQQRHVLPLTEPPHVMVIGGSAQMLKRDYSPGQWRATKPPVERRSLENREPVLPRLAALVSKRTPAT